MSIMDALDHVNVLCPPAPYSAFAEETWHPPFDTW